MKNKEFRPNEITEAAFDIYSNSDFNFYTDSEGIYYVGLNAKTSDIQELGGIADVEEYLLSFVDED